MTRLEQRYRRLLRVLPAWYRAEREREMVDVFLECRADRDSADLDAEYGWPGWSETAAVAGLAVRTRVGGHAAPSGPRAVGDTIRAAAGIAVLLNAAGAATTVLWQVVATLVGPPEAAVVTDSLLHPLGAGGWWATLSLVLRLCWLPAWTALTSQRRRSTLLLAAAACTPSVVGAVSIVVEGDGSFALISLASSLIELSTVALLLLGYPRATPLPTVARPWSLLAGAVVVLAAVTPLALVVRQDFAPEAAFLLLAAVTLAVTRRRGPLAAGITVLAVVAVVSGLLDLAALEDGYGGALITVALGLGAALVAASAARRPARDLAGT
ncbi:hypothetical protein LQ327_32895 [Actinomycetospora endophytica]|uniref:Membrane protein DUF2157 n=1 Tax=Actinomycetospora endophytica TaxID=2291215 RepID=A0ABS8PIU6_9PSEU|nr:hypothetical protein [Actinomycetospora endophytica]MCD2198179.1 hypothetical protein [Actinomycetospora endophytica]